MGFRAEQSNGQNASAAAQDQQYKPHFGAEFTAPNVYDVDLLDAMGVFTEAGFLQSLEECFSSIDNDVCNFPDFKHLIAIVGEPANGKTMTVKTIAHLLQRSRAEWEETFPRRKLDVIFSDFSWGKYIDPEVNEKRNHHSSPEARPAKLHETATTEKNLRQHLLAYVDMPPCDDKVEVGVFDIPFVTGIPGEDHEQTTGVPRGFSMLSHLARHEGEFADKPYLIHVIAISSTPEVREEGLTSRKRLEVQTTEERIALLVNNGIVDRGSGQNAIADYVTESAEPDQVLLCWKDTDQVIHQMVAEGHVDYPEVERISSDTDIYFYQLERHRILGQQVLPVMMRMAGVPEERGIILNNRLKVDEINALLA